MGVLNLTPDSFSDGGRFGASGEIDVNSVIDAAAEMIKQGADWLDIGGESTRPGAIPISEQEELDRVAPALEALAHRFDLPLSVDTSTPAVITESAHFGARMINDVRALTKPNALMSFIATDMSVCLMHMQGEPTSMQQQPSYGSVTEEVKGFLGQRADALVSEGVSKERICIDPGFGFGKSIDHNLQLLQGIPSLMELGYPILVGLSRKSMIGTITGRDIGDRLPGTIGLNMLALHGGASILRVHDVAAAVDTVKIWQRFAQANSLERD